MKNAIIVSLLVVIALLALGNRDRGEAQAMIEDTSLSARPSPPTGARALHHADFPACVTIRPEPLLRTPNGRLDYRLGKPSNDRGDA